MLLLDHPLLVKPDLCVVANCSKKLHLFCSFSFSSLRVRDKSKAPLKDADETEHTDIQESSNRDAACGKCVYCVAYMDKLRAMYKKIHKEITNWCALVYCKLQETYQRCKAWWKSRMPSVKVCWVIC